MHTYAIHYLEQNMHRDLPFASISLQKTPTEFVFTPDVLNAKQPGMSGKSRFT